ncbi:MAG: N-acetylmuramoyl-L-alanine amidase, partial [Acidimicrobiales bacterium]
PRPLIAAWSARPAAAAHAGPGAPQPDIVSRAEWGADESLRNGTPEYAPVGRFSIHHTVTASADPNPAATLRAILAYHVVANGWQDIGYNFLVDAQGRVYEGRHARSYRLGEEPTGLALDGQGVVGAHTLGNNTGTVGVALLGTYSSTAPATAAMRSLERLLAWSADRHGIDPLGVTQWTTGTHPTIVGHRDAVATACPGDLLYAALPAVRREVANNIADAHGATLTRGYWVLAANGRLVRFGEAQPWREVPGPATSLASTPAANGVWALSSGGRVTAYGDAGLFGSTEGTRLNAPAVRLEPTPTGRGYWLLGGDGGVFSFGDAEFFGSTGNLRLNAPVISMASTPTGKGYWLLARDGGVFTFGDAEFLGSTGDLRLNAPVSSMAPHPSGKGYWLQATDGGIFSFGALTFHGSLPGLGLPGTARTVQIRATSTGNGYYVLGADGGIFTFGDTRFLGADPSLAAAGGAVDLALRNNLRPAV